MPKKSPNSAKRDRHGRGVRHSLTGALYRTGGSNQDQFRLIVAATVEYIKERWPDELGDMRAIILDAPILGANSTHVKRWSIRKPSKTIILYRLPILRLEPIGNSNDERIRIEHHVFEAAAALIDKEPWELILGEEDD